MLFRDRLYFTLFFSARQRIRFYKKLALMLQHGITLYTSLRHLHRVALEHRACHRYAMQYLLRCLSCGYSFAQCIGGICGAHELLLIASSEKENLARGLTEAQALLQQKEKLRRRVLQTLGYPCFLVLLTCGLFLLIGRLLVPSFLELVPQAEWQGAARFLLLVAEISEGKAALGIFGFLVVLGLALPYSLPRLTGRLRLTLDRLFPWNIYRLLVGASWLLSFSALLAQGIQPRAILLATLGSRHTSPYLRERVLAIWQALARGKNLGEAFGESAFLFPSRDLVEDLRVLGNLPGLEEEMAGIARQSLEDTHERICGILRRLSLLLLLLVTALIFCVLQGLSALELQLTGL